MLVSRHQASPPELLAGEGQHEILHYELLPVVAYAAEEDERLVVEAQDDVVLVHPAEEHSVAVVVGREAEAGKEFSQEELDGCFEDASRGEALGRRVQLRSDDLSGIWDCSYPEFLVYGCSNSDGSQIISLDLREDQRLELQLPALADMFVLSYGPCTFSSHESCPSHRSPQQWRPTAHGTVDCE